MSHPQRCYIFTIRRKDTCNKGEKRVKGRKIGWKYESLVVDENLNQGR